MAQAQITPSVVTLGISQKQQFTVIGQPQVQWSVYPAGTGTITSSGLYTAPPNYGSSYVYIYARTGSLYYQTLVHLSQAPAPTAPSVHPVSISVAPTSVYLYGGQSKQFTATVAGNSDTQVLWSVTQGKGSILNGLYSAPSSITSDSLVTIAATSVADPTKTASATIQLGPSLTSNSTSQPASVSISLKPTAASLKAGQSKRFTATVSGSTNTAVTWAVSPSTGSLVNGLYTAPTNLTGAQTITVTATSAADTTKRAMATIQVSAPTASPATPAPSVSPATATVAPSGTLQFAVQNLPAGTTVSWSASPALVGSITTAGLYKAPTTVATQQGVTITAKNSATQAVLGTATVTLTASPAAASTAITLPLEVIGPDGTTVSSTFAIPQGANLNGVQLWMQIHGLKYETEASVEVNNSGWLPISTGHVTLLGNAAAFGGIGGGFRTLKMTLNLPAGSVVTGTNTITFRFNGTNGVVSGYRVLAFNLVTGGTNLLSPSLFTNDDPNTWKAPLNDLADIAAGLLLYQNAALTVPVTGAGAQTIGAHCSDCHTRDGRDLKYFNYSNKSIEARSAFHGLTALQGEQIASYIRSLNVPNPGRPWNPPYQPGPGLDSQPVANWAAGAGLDAVVESDSDMLAYVAPSGSTAGWSATSYLNPRETPIPMQMLDWNSWLPVIHPMDAFGTSFTNSSFNKDFTTLRNEMQPNSPSTYSNAVMNTIPVWLEAGNSFMSPIIANATASNWAGNLRSEVYSIGLWEMVKSWEINQEFGLEAMPQVPFGAKADVRGWYGSVPFGAAPNMLHIASGPGIGNGSQIARDYLTLNWYQTQLVLNDGQGQQTGHSPIDYGYVSGFIYNVFVLEAQLPAMSLQLEWLVKSLQEFTQSGIGPQGIPGVAGWAPTATNPMTLVDFHEIPLWSALSASTQATLTQAYTAAWFAQASKYTPQQYYAGGWASPTDNPAALSWNTTFGGEMWYMLPRLRLAGVDPALVARITSWAQTIWPLGNWSLINSASCTSLFQCTSGY